MLRLFKSVIVLAMALYVVALGALYALQDGLVFPASADTAVSLPVGAAYIEMETSDGETLRHVRFEADPGAPKLMFFHGNGSLASFETKRGKTLFENGFDVLLVEYRGYGGSSGAPSAQALLRDSLEIYDWYKGEGDDWVFLYSHSLGTGIATYLSSKREIRSMVLEAPYSSLSDVAAERYPMFPVKTLFKHEIDSVEHLKGSTTPTLLIHGDQDEVIPIHFGQRLFDSLEKDRANWKRLEGVGHNNLTQNGSIDLALEHFIKAF